ncbi:hypothetical protein RUM44_009017 [Polyplax serrata]|uniref:Uncharacterized protein n=1 Tax=Polyplax serrata TaxID=468196 RepID=A0ABR1ARJ6_POLSC
MKGGKLKTHDLIIVVNVDLCYEIGVFYILISPILAGIAVSVGVPILLFYVYGVVPVSLCRSGGCGVSTSGTGVRFDFDDENEMNNRNTDAVSMDTVSHRGANPSIGEASLSLGSGSQLERLGRENDRESVSNVALAGASIAGSIASSGLTNMQRLEVQADVSSTQRFSMSSETASAATSLSDKSVSASYADDGAASVRALAGSVLNFKVETSSVASFRPGDSSGLADNASQRSEDTGPASLSSLEELTSGLLRRVTGGRRRLERQVQLPEQHLGSENGGSTGTEDSISERVRFDSHVSYIAPPKEGHCVVEVETPSTTSSPVTEKTSLRNTLFCSQLETTKRFGKLRKTTPPHDQVDLTVITDLHTSGMASKSPHGGEVL